MHVLLGAFGTRGDVQPMLALSLALRARGHRVTLAVPPNSVEWVRSFGLQAVAAGLDYQALARTFGNDVFRALPVMRAEVEQQRAGLQGVAPDADLVVGSSVFAMGPSLAELRGIPFRYIAFSPSLFPSAEHPSPFVRSQRLPRWVNRASWRLNDLAWRLVFRGPINGARARCGLPPMRTAVWRHITGHAVFVASEPVLAPVPADTGYDVFQPGPFLLDDPQPLSPATEAFLGAGPPPVYVGFGSMGDAHPERTARLLVAAVHASGQRAIVSRGWAGFPGESTSDLLFMDAEPHAKLFPRCSLVAHHGGAGTSTAALHAGVPQLPLPYLLDQFYWAERVARLRVGPGPIPRGSLTVATLAAAIRAGATVRAYAETAREVSVRCTRDGLARAVAELEATIPRAAAPFVSRLPG